MFADPGRDPDREADPHDDVGELLDDDPGESDTAAHADYPNVKSDDWPGRDLDVITTTERAFLVHTDGPREDGDPTQWYATDAGLYNLEDCR